MKVLKFYATWCGPCKGLSAVLGGMTNVPLAVEEVDIDQNLDLAKQYSIRSVPTMVIVNEDGTEVKRAVGMLTEAQVLKFMEV